MNVAGVLGAPSLPKFTPPEASPRAADQAPSDLSRRARADAAAPTTPRSASSETAAPTRTSSIIRSFRPESGPVAVAGKGWTPPASHGRPAVAVQRIVESAALLRPEKATRLRLALHPDRLGELVVDLSLRGGEVQVTVLAASEAAKDAIAARLDDLRAGLERKGIPVGDIRIAVAGSEEEVLLAGPRSLRLHLVDLWA